MVRIKHRYLLINILYPDQEPKPTRQSNGIKEDLPYALQFRQPSSDHLNAKLLARIIRDGVADLFGDYGSGMIAGSLVGTYLLPFLSYGA
jgi:ribonuclease P/MRP protein subunit POP5